ncbi:GAF domain-containing protein [Methylomonas sp. SURF-2]|uniref:GAF domain-containing protein n=1 Tax=Methylomonas subterranea TaxID=2952225 RepID=A0ABT1TI24_9GAMM|nr:HD domain-containing phosphohydrolase [Methylomonas sp. SURF-2]MCQ8104419.1 GAF domain-containing protein [Methylomonas sp. SURF-2]
MQQTHNLILLYGDMLGGPALQRSIESAADGCDTYLLHDADQIITELQRGNFDILVLDADNELLEVSELLPLLRRQFQPAELPILVLSDRLSTDNCNIALSLGASDFITKPLSADEVKIKIRNALALRQCFKAQQLTRNQLEQQVRIRTAKLNMLIDSGLMMSREKSRERLLAHILREGQKLLHCDGGTIFLVTKNRSLRFAIRTRDDTLPFDEIELYDPVSGQINDRYASTYAANHNETVIIDNVYAETRFDCSGTQAFDAQSGYRTVSLLTAPMAPRSGQVIGILQFFNALDPRTGAVIPFPPDIVELVEALAAQSAIALDNLQLIEGQKNTTESIIRVLASAIDTKSPHTGHHCVRVPELAVMLADAACRQTEGPLAHFNFESEDQWLEFRVGAWLHDCGKVTTPEYVIEKATKLDMLFNRIHEIRMRFEVLLRDADIRRLETLLDGGDSTEADRRFEREKAELMQDFAFIAECNMGRESMHPNDCDRIKTIAEKTWLRYFDDTLGLSQHDTLRLRAEDKPSLPVAERLLADKPKHIVPRPEHKVPDPALGIKMDIPENMFNYGEIYNLSIQKGTLTAEERYKINEHIIETINLLEKIPFPDFLQRVPEYASTHHETLDGRGYPRKLTAKELSIPARIMAVADIFEAITASDRPYKKPYTLSESLKILCAMKNNRHIDADIFELFLTSGVYRQFALKYLLPEQIDEVDIFEYLDKAS